MSEEDGETADSLDIKPPQARVAQSSSSRMKRRDAHDGKSRHKRSERHRDDRSHSHREKHHREKQLRSTKDRESYHREKERYYREQMSYKDSYADLQYYREHKEELARSSRHSESRKKESREIRDSREARYIEKHRRERYMEDKWEKSAGDKALEDLRERLLSKRSTKGDEDSYRFEKSEGHKERKYKENESLDSVLQGEAGMYVKEIINISTGEDKRHKKQERNREEDKLTEEERAEQELRREKLLEAG